MFSLRQILILALFLIFIIPGINAQSVGVSPPVLNLGEIQPGTSKIVTFYVVTVSEEVLLVRLGKTKGNIDMLKKEEYKNVITNYSEQDILPWIEFISNPVELTKNEETSKTKAGSTIKGAREVNFILKVPKDAEPGYHMGVITLDPLIPQTGRPITIKAVVPFTFIFKIPGKAIRDGKIFEVSSGGYYNYDLIIDIFFQNTGTVTISTLPIEIKIFDKKNNLIDSLSSRIVYVKPGEMMHLTANWDVKDVELGIYNARVKIDYITGYAFKESTIEVYEKPQMIPARIVEKEFAFPWWVVVIIGLIVIIAYIYYKR
jgi:hypothetical protein